MPHKIDHRRGAVPPDVKFGVGITPFGGVTLAGSQNWFDLLQAANVYSVRRKSEPGHNKVNRVRNFQRRRSKTVDGDRPTETNTIEKTTSEQPKICLQKSSEPVKPRIPVINIIRASNESIPGLFISDSSDEESDYEDNDECVYECPGLAASAEDMTVSNPLFQEKHFQCSYRTPELPQKYWKDVFVESV